MGTCKLTIGNGFDLFCSLNTRYNDFFESKSQKEVCKYIEDFREAFNSYGDVIDNNFNYDLSQGITFWDVLFYEDPNRELKHKWCDVEKFLFNFFYEKNNNESDFNLIYSNVITFVNTKSVDLYELSYRLKLPCLFCLMKTKVKNKDEFASFLLQELQDFEKKFGDFVSKEFKNNYDNFINYYYYFINECIPHNLNIVEMDTFNYTPIETIKSGYNKRGVQINLTQMIKHINGDYNLPIFGIDSSKFKVSNECYIFTKTYRRITSDFFEEKNIQINENSTFKDLVIFGHSLNEQDYNYYFPIFDYLKLMDITSDSKVYFLYNIYDEKKRSKIKKENVKSLYSILNAYEEYKSGKNKDYRLIDTLSSRGRLIFKEVIHPDVHQISLY